MEPTEKTPVAKDRKSKRGDVRRDLLVQAAASLFWTKGYHATSLADVAKNADIPLGNLYYYYKTKAHLALGVANLFVEQTELLISSVSAEEDEPRKRLKLLILRIKQTQGERLVYGCPIAAACRDYRQTAPDASQKAATSFLLLINFIAQELQRTGLRPSTAMIKARQTLTDWQGGIVVAHALGQANVLAETYGRMERQLLAS